MSQPTGPGEFPGPGQPRRTPPAAPGQPAAVGRRQRLSLRARLLVLLVAVTAAFLVIMGLVTAVVLSTRLSGQFRDDLMAAAARSPQAIAANPAGNLAVALSVRTGQATTITSGSQSSKLAAAVSQLSRPQLIRDYARQPFPVTLPGGATVLAVARLAAGASIPATPPWRGLALLVVGRPESRITSPLHGVILAELITGGGLLLLLAIGGQWLIAQGLSPLGAMAATANRITARGDLTARMAEAGDGTEAGQLGSAINTMLDRIQHAFADRLRSEEKVRQFAADASHELRTPLTTIRGYAELYRQGALGPGQLPDAMRRIEQEAQRMSRLVAELLELARLDRGSSLDLAETDLATLVRDAAADARAVEPGRPVQAETPDQLLAVVDEARIRQVLANLLANVREHTPDTVATWVRLAPVRGGVVL